MWYIIGVDYVGVFILGGEGAGRRGVHGWQAFFLGGVGEVAGGGQGDEGS